MPAEDSRRRVNRTLGHLTQERQNSSAETRTGIVDTGTGRGRELDRIEFCAIELDRVLCKYLSWCKTPTHEPPGSFLAPRGGHQGRSRTCRPRPTTPRIICGQGPMIKRFCRARAAGEARPVRVARPIPYYPAALHARAVLPTHRPGSRAARTRPRHAPAPAARSHPHPSAPPGRPANPPPHARSSAPQSSDGSSPFEPRLL